VANCDDNVEGFHNHGGCSTYYWVCEWTGTSWRIHEKNCIEGLVFDIVDQACDWPFNVDACL
jgi:hypothetical protein